MIHADSSWLKQTLGPSFEGFTNRWRDQDHPEKARFWPLIWNTARIGHVPAALGPQVLQALHDAGLNHQTHDTHLEINTRLEGDALSTALAELANRLKHNGLVPGWRNENQRLEEKHAGLSAEMERAAFKVLGLRSRAVHVHVQTPKGLVWVGIRSDSKHENPGMLDNLAAGGIAQRETVLDTLWRELGEEAGLCADDFQHMNAFEPHEFTISRPMADSGWHHETVYFFHGTLKMGRRPTNRDSEVCGFQLMTSQACRNAVNAWAFTPDAGLCTALALLKNTSHS
jgi:8-oxo-dGTP pyrophosphatase MutT (NUDIX family)